MTRRLLLATAALCALFALGQTARADTFVITTGTATGFAAGNDMPFTINFAGRDSAGQTFSVQGSGESYLFSARNVTLPGGSTLTSSATFSLGLIPPGSATFNGVSYTQIRLVNSSLQATHGTITLPPAGSNNELTPVTTSFTLTGTLNVVDAATGAPLFSVDLVGSGLVTINFRSVPTGVIAEGVTYTFADPTAVPEPATLALLGAGIGGLALKRRRRKRE